MIFGGYDFSHLLKVEKINRPLLPSIEVEHQRRTGRDGSRTTSVTLEPITVEVEVRLIEPGNGKLEAARREIAAHLFGREKRELILHDSPDLSYMAVLEGDTDQDVLLFTSGVTLRFFCEDPVRFGAENVRYSDGGLMSCNVGGTYATAPVISVETEGSDAVVYVDGQPLTALGTVSGDHPLVFDCVSHVTTKGGAAVKLSVYDDYATWEPGTHTVQCEHPFEVRWVERWL